MQELEMSRKSLVFRGGLLGWYMINFDKIDEIISEPDSSHRLRIHQNRNFNTCDLFWGWVFNVVFWWWAVTVAGLFVFAVLFAFSMLFDISRFLLGYRPEWEIFRGIKNIFSKDFSIDYEVFSFENHRPLFRGMKNRFLYLRPIYFLCWGVFLYGIFVNPNFAVPAMPSFSNLHNFVLTCSFLVVGLTGVYLVGTLCRELKNWINLRRYLKTTAKSDSSENRSEVGKVRSEFRIVWRAFHNRACIPIKVKD